MRGRGVPDPRGLREEWKGGGKRGLIRIKTPNHTKRSVNHKVIPIQVQYPEFLSTPKVYKTPEAERGTWGAGEAKNEVMGVRRKRVPRCLEYVSFFIYVNHSLYRRQEGRDDQGTFSGPHHSHSSGGRSFDFLSTSYAPTSTGLDDWRGRKKKTLAEDGVVDMDGRSSSAESGRTSAWKSRCMSDEGAGGGQETRTNSTNVQTYGVLRTIYGHWSYVLCHLEKARKRRRRVVPAAGSA